MGADEIPSKDLIVPLGAWLGAIAPGYLLEKRPGFNEDLPPYCVGIEPCLSPPWQLKGGVALLIYKSDESCRLLKRITSGVHDDVRGARTIPSAEPQPP